MLLKSVGIADILRMMLAGLKKPIVVNAIVSIVNGIIFARSRDKSSLRYDVILTDATKAVVMVRMVVISSSSASSRIKIDMIANQKNVMIGSSIMYSIVKKRMAKNFASSEFS